MSGLLIYYTLLKILVEIRTLAEEPGVYEELRAFLNLVLWRDFIDRRFYAKLTVEDPNYDSRCVFIGLERGEIVATAFGIRRTREPLAAVEAQKNIGWIKMLAVQPGYEEVLARVIEALEDFMKRDGRRQVRVSDYASWYLTPGVDLEYQNLYSLLRNRGYVKVGEAVNYELDLSRFYMPERVRKLAENLEKRGIRVRRVSVMDEELEEWIEKRFSPFWRTEAVMALEAEDGGVLVAEVEGRIAGFSVYGALKPNFFGPIGVDPSFRRVGIGTLLLFRTLREMRIEGVRIAVIPWTSHLFFYSQLPGVTGIRHFHILARDL